MFGLEQHLGSPSLAQVPVIGKLLSGQLSEAATHLPPFISQLPNVLDVLVELFVNM